MPVQIDHEQEKDFQIISLSGELKVNDIVPIKREFESLATTHLNIAINLSKTTAMDSSGINLIVNLYKKLSEEKRYLCLFQPNQKVQQLFQEMNFDKSVRVYSTKEEFYKDQIANVVDDLFPPPDFDFDDKLYKLFELKCELCGFDGIRGFALNKATQEVQFDEHLAPTFHGRPGNNDLDIHTLQMTICPACQFSTRHLNYFSAKTGEFKSALTEKEKHTLVKEGLVRKRMAKKSALKWDETMVAPYSGMNLYWSYLFAEECAHTLFRGENRIATYDLAHYNTVMSRLVKPNEEEDLLRKAYMWFGEIHRQPLHFSTGTLVEAYYFLSVIGRRLKKNKEAERYMSEFRKLNAPAENYRLYLMAAEHRMQ